MIIGLSGKKQHGKSTVAGHLKRYEFKEVSWAEPLKEIIGKDLFGFTHAQVYDDKLKEVIDPFWGFSPREALQKTGTDCFRRIIHPDFWVKLTQRKLEKLKDFNVDVVVSDCRFLNEVEAIKKLGGKVIRVRRSDVIDTDTHASETELDDYDQFDCIFSAASGDIESLKNQADAFVKGVRALNAF